MIDQLPFKTSDLPLAAYLNLRYYLQDVDITTNPKRGMFFFTLHKDQVHPEPIRGVSGQMVTFRTIADEARYFHSGFARVEPQAYFGSLRTLKARLYANR